MSEQHLKRLLRIDTRGEHSGALSRHLGDLVEQRLLAANRDMEVVRRQLDRHIPLVDDAWIEANLTPEAERSAGQHGQLAVSDRLIAELHNSDALLITVPMHNFSIPGALKAWVDQVCRAGLTFRYTASGPQGLLADRPTYLVVTTGGVKLGSDYDFLSGYVTRILNFIGITDIRMVTAEQVNLDVQRAIETAHAQLAQLLPQPFQEDIA